ncbi:energy transducer TonB [Sphingomonas sp. MMS24-JH45]
MSTTSISPAAASSRSEGHAMAYARDQVAGSRRFSIIAGVAAVHGAIGYLFVSGMAVEIAAKFVPTLTTTNVPIDVPPPPEPAPPPRPEAKTVPSHTAPTASTTILESPASSWTVTIAPGPLTLDPPVLVPFDPPAPPPPAPSLAVGAEVRGDRTAWFGTDDYPPSAIRAEEEGTVAVALGIGGDSRVTSCRVTASSGSSALDQVTCRLYQKRARFTPARDAGGATIAASYSDRVVWRLPLR